MTYKSIHRTTEHKWSVETQCCISYACTFRPLQLYFPCISTKTVALRCVSIRPSHPITNYGFSVGQDVTAVMTIQGPVPVGSQRSRQLLNYKAEFKKVKRPTVPPLSGLQNGDKWQLNWIIKVSLSSWLITSLQLIIHQRMHKWFTLKLKLSLQLL